MGCRPERAGAQKPGRALECPQLRLHAERGNERVSVISPGISFLRVNDLPRYWHTLKYLRPAQFYGRLYFRLARLRPCLAAAPAQREARGEWCWPACRQPSLTGPRAFRFLNVAGNLDEVGWDGAEREKLWRYNQHYFDDLNAHDAGSRGDWHAGLIADWIAANPPGSGTGWEPYPTSLRIVNWVKWSLAGHELPDAVRHSLVVQVRWLRRRLEWHLLGNHLFANAKAMIFAGCYFDGPEASAWLDKGLAILAAELPEQILADGGQFERSPMYHALAVEDVLDLINVFRACPDAVPQTWRSWSEALSGLASLMLDWLAVMCHPDGEIAFFNDAATRVAPTPQELAEYAARLGVRCQVAVGAQPPSRLGLSGLAHSDRSVEGLSSDDVTVRQLAESGYIRLSAPQAVALLDVAPIGPDYLPGHAHADTLSFELSLCGQRVIVNGGTSCYGLGPERLRQRATAAHSTVEVGGENSSELWGGFRVARRARPFDLLVNASVGGVAVSCYHDGYRRLSGGPIHKREWRMTPTGLEVRDSVSGSLPAVARFLLHPDIQVSIERSSRCLLTLPGGERVSIEVVVGEFRLESSYYAPEFGKIIETRCLAVVLVGGASVTKLQWC